MDWFLYEKAAAQKGYSHICGIDEAGRGPLAAPVFAAAVILPVDVEIPGLNDSKKLSEKKREVLFDVIQKTAVSCSVAFATEQEIDEMNILQATFWLCGELSKGCLCLQIMRWWMETVCLCCRFKEKQL